MSYDICFCANKSCPLRPNCYRNTDRIDPEYPLPVSMSDFSLDENGECYYYCPVVEEAEVPDVYKPILHDCRKCKRGKLDYEGHVFCTAIGEWGDLSECDWWCRFFKEKKHKRKGKWAK